MISNRNIPLMYLIRRCRGLLFSVAVTYLFYNHYNLWTTELYIVQSVFAVGVVFLEIPTGFISDKYSRKRSLIIGTLCSAIGFLVYSQGTGLWHFIIAELILVLWYCCLSGTDTALLYDSMAQDNQTDNYKIISGRYHAIASFAEAIGGISGAYIAVWWLSIPFVLDGLFAGIACILAIFLIEPRRSKLDAGEWTRTQVRWILFWVYNHPKVLWLIIFSAVTGCMTLTMVWFSQPYMQLVQLPMTRIGRFWFVMNAGGSIASLFIHKIEKILTERWFMLAIVVWWVVCMMILALFPSLWILSVFLLFQITRQGNRLVSNDNLHHLSDSSIRATIWSINSMAFRLAFAVWGPIFGWLYSQYGLAPALSSSSIVLGGLAIWAWWKFEHKTI